MNGVQVTGPGGFTVTPKGAHVGRCAGRPLTACLQKGRGVWAGTASLARRPLVLHPGPCSCPSSPRVPWESSLLGPFQGLRLCKGHERLQGTLPPGAAGTPGRELMPLRLSSSPPVLFPRPAHDRSTGICCRIQGWAQPQQDEDRVWAPKSSPYSKSESLEAAGEGPRSSITGGQEAAGTGHGKHSRCSEDRRTLLLFCLFIIFAFLFTFSLFLSHCNASTGNLHCDISFRCTDSDGTLSFLFFF